MIGGRTPEELGTLLEDAILLGDADAVAGLDAVATRWPGSSSPAACWSSDDSLSADRRSRSPR